MWQTSKVPMPNGSKRLVARRVLDASYAGIEFGETTSRRAFVKRNCLNGPEMYRHTRYTGTALPTIAEVWCEMYNHPVNHHMI